MRILIYLQNIDKTSGGIRNYAITLLRMFRKDFINHYFIYHDLNDPEIIDALQCIPNSTLVTSIEINFVKKIIVRDSIKKLNKIPFLRRITKKKQITIREDLSTYCKKKAIQIIHCPYQYLPEIKDVKLITTMHDVQEIHFPEFFSAEERAYRAKNYLDFLSRSNSVIVSFNHVKQDLNKYFNVPYEKIKIIFLEMNQLWLKKFTEKDIINLPHELDIKKFILYPAIPFKHKNHLRLLEAIALLRDEKKIKVNIVLTGDFNHKNGKVVLEKVQQLMLDNQVTLLGIVEESMLFSLYKKAVAIVIPTLYEAGSFPLIESLLLGVPVICSNVTSLPETIGNNDFIFDPTDIKSMAEMIKNIYTDEEFRKRSKLNSLIQREKFKNSNSFELVKETYLSLLNEI